MALTPSAWYCRDNATINAITFTGSTAGSTTLTTSGSPALAVGMVVWASGATYLGVITAGSANSWTLSASSTVASQTMVAFAGMAAGSVGWSGVTAWAPSTAYTVGQLVRQKNIASVFTASTSGASTTLTISAITSGGVAPGQSLFYAGSSTTPPTFSAYGTSTGSTGTMTMSGSATIASQLMLSLLTPGNERVFACIVAGTSGSTEPTWVLTKGAKTTDNTVTWIEVTGQPGVNGDGKVTVATNAITPSTAASPTILPVSNTTGIQIGMHCSDDTGGGTYLFNHPCFVTAIVGNTSVAVSSSTFGSIPSGASFSFGNSPFAFSARSSPVALGLIIIDPVTNSLQVVTTAGTCAASAPSFSATAGVTTTDNTATWTSLGAVKSAWAAPAARLASMMSASWSAAGDKIFAAADHAEVQPTAINIISINGTPASPNYVISVAAATVPPTSASWSAGASVTTVGPNALTLINSSAAGIHIYGITASAGSGATTAVLTAGANRCVLDTCTLAKLGTTGNAIGINIGGQAVSSNLVTHCSFKFGATSDTITTNGRTRYENISTLLASGSAVPTAMFGMAAGPVMEFAGCDFSPLGTGTVITNATTSNGLTVLSGCKLAAAAILSATPGNGVLVDALNCDSAATDYQKARYAYAGTLTTETSVVRTSGAVVDATHVSDKIATNTNTSWINSFASIPLAIWNAITGSSVTVTVYGVYNGAALPNNDEIWMEVEYPGSASSPLASIATTTKANAMTTAAAVTSDTSAWDSVATARANSTAYALGDARSVSSNTGRIFFCTTAGTSSGSLPAGYASAVDGGSVTDGTAVFRAGERFKLTSTFTPQLAGPVYVRPRAGRVSSTYYIDPLPVLS